MRAGQGRHQGGRKLAPLGRVPWAGSVVSPRACNRANGHLEWPPSAKGSKSDQNGPLAILSGDRIPGFKGPQLSGAMGHQDGRTFPLLAPCPSVSEGPWPASQRKRSKGGTAPYEGDARGKKSCNIKGVSAPAGQASDRVSKVAHGTQKWHAGNPGLGLFQPFGMLRAACPASRRWDSETDLSVR